VDAEPPVRNPSREVADDVQIRPARAFELPGRVKRAVPPAASTLVTEPQWARGDLNSPERRPVQG
jgi:hypothetical protein